MRPKSPQEEVIRAGEAQQVLNSQLMTEARKYVDSVLADSRRTVPMRDTDMHTRLIIMEQLWGYLITFLEQTAQSGQLAQIQLRQEEQRLSPAQYSALFRH